MAIPDGLIVRPLRATDSITELTDLLHRAYGRLAETGVRMVASWQDEAMTRARAEAGECFVCELDGRLVGTVTFRDAAGTAGSPWLDRPDVASFGQFCVDPPLQGRGIASVLLDRVEQRARETGAAEIACDTAEHAHRLIRYYQRRGYRIVDRADWELTDFLSVVLSKRLD